MKLIVGLGNPGKEYQQTRHNVGFLFVDELATKLKIEFEKNKYVDSEVAANSDFILAKPHTFMNNSGQAVKSLITYYDLPIANLIVIHDDLDIPLGQYKIQHAVGPKMHNGIISIENEVKSNQFTRIRIGVDNRDPENRIPGDVYVLQKFTDDEMKILKGVIENIVVEFMNDL